MKYTKKFKYFKKNNAAIVYNKLIDFPKNFQFTSSRSSFTSRKRFEEYFHLATSKKHCHHFHVTDKILVCVHDFCNWIVRKKVFGDVFRSQSFRLWFLFFCILKGVWLSVWSTEDLKVGVKKRNSINYAYLENFVKFINTIKYY